MLLLYMRHGETKHSKHGVVSRFNERLSCWGGFLVRKSVKYIKQENVVKIYCSPCVRALETAKIVSNKLHIPYEICDELVEREGIKLSEIKSDKDKVYADNYMNLNFNLDSREVCKQYFDRNFSLFDKIIKNHKDKSENVIVIAHSSTLYAISAYFHGLPKDGNVVWMQCSNCTTIKFEVK